MKINSNWNFESFVTSYNVNSLLMLCDSRGIYLPYVLEYTFSLISDLCLGQLEDENRRWSYDGRLVHLSRPYSIHFGCCYNTGTEVIKAQYSINYELSSKSEFNLFDFYAMAQCFLAHCQLNSIYLKKIYRTGTYKIYRFMAVKTLKKKSMYGNLKHASITWNHSQEHKQKRHWY